MAFNEVGGPAYLTKVANEDYKTFCALLGKALPMQISGDPANPVVTRVEVAFVDPTPHNRQGV